MPEPAEGIDRIRQIFRAVPNIFRTDRQRAPQFLDAESVSYAVDPLQAGHAAGPQLFVHSFTTTSGNADTIDVLRGGLVDVPASRLLEATQQRATMVRAEVATAGTTGSSDVRFRIRDRSNQNTFNISRDASVSNSSKQIYQLGFDAIDDNGPSESFILPQLVVTNRYALECRHNNGTDAPRTIEFKVWLYSGVDGQETPTL
jgi:hypothetical protein